MTQEFNKFYDELKKRIINETVERLHDSWMKDEWRDDTFTTDEIINIKTKVEDGNLMLLMKDLEYLLDEDSSDILSKIRESLNELDFKIEP